MVLLGGEGGEYHKEDGPLLYHNIHRLPPPVQKYRTYRGMVSGEYYDVAVVRLPCGTHPPLQ